MGCSSNENGLKHKDSQKSEVIAILLNYWDGESSAVVFYDSSLLTKSINENKIYKYKSEVEEFVTVRNLVSKSAFEYLEQYMKSNCNETFPGKSDLEVPHNFYTIKLIQETQIQNCYYYANNLDFVINYFVGMKNWIEKSDYKKEFGQLLSYLNGNIKSLTALKDYH